MQMIGGFRASYGGVDCTFTGRKTQALFVYLAFRKNMIESRERIAGLLWSENGEEAARVSLRQQISGLRRETEHLPFAVFGCDRTSVWLQPNQVGCDVFEILADLEHGIVPEIMLTGPRLLDDLLANLHDLDPAYETWLTIQRESLRDQVLMRLQEQAGTEGNELASERVAAAIHNVDPANEAACRRLMQSRFERGDVAGALRLYRELWNLLDTECDMEPSAKTQALVAEIKRADPEAEPAIAAGRARLSPPPPAKRVAALRTSSEPPLILVRAFDDGGVDQSDMRRVNAFRHDLIAALTRVRGWLVHEHAAAADVMPCGGHEAYELLGTATTEDSHIRLTMLLRRHCDGFYMWSETATIDLGNWHRAKLHIIEHFAAALAIELSAERPAITARMPGRDRDVRPAVLPRRMPAPPRSALLAIMPFRAYPASAFAKAGRCSLHSPARSARRWSRARS
jgi:DNA-binding SARP family transcriptional activator